MKTGIASLLLLAMVSQVGSRVGIMLSFSINREYIVNVLCENKNKPEMACNGHCYLKKQLDKQQEEESKLPQKLIVKETFLISIPLISYQLGCAAHEQEAAQGSFYLAKKKQSFYPDFFHPPAHQVLSNA